MFRKKKQITSKQKWIVFLWVFYINIMIISVYMYIARRNNYVYFWFFETRILFKYTDHEQLLYNYHKS